MGDYQQGVYRPCECDSGKKYKFCCIGRDRVRAKEVANLPLSTMMAIAAAFGLRGGR